LETGCAVDPEFRCWRVDSIDVSDPANYGLGDRARNCMPTFFCAG